MQIDFNSIAVHCLPNIVKAQVYGLLEERFINWRQMVQLDFSLTGNVHLHAVLIDDRFSNHGALLVKNDQASDSLPERAATCRWHKEHKLRVVTAKADLSDVFRRGIRLPQTWSKHLIVCLKHGHDVTLPELTLRSCCLRVQIDQGTETESRIRSQVHWGYSSGCGRMVTSRDSTLALLLSLYQARRCLCYVLIWW